MRWRLKSPSSRVFTQPFIQAPIKETSKLRVTGFCAGNSPLTGEFPAQRANNADNVWWRHCGNGLVCRLTQICCRHLSQCRRIMDQAVRNAIYDILFMVMHSKISSAIYRPLRLQPYQLKPITFSKRFDIRQKWICDFRCHCLKQSPVYCRVITKQNTDLLTTGFVGINFILVRVKIHRVIFLIWDAPMM